MGMRILAFAYACEPDKGSEPAAGWLWVRMLARMAEVWVVTRANNREAIEARLEQLPERSQLHFVYIDLPPWARFWKRGGRGVRVYYLLWQLAALRKARSLNVMMEFDVIWHLTLANAWLGSVGGWVGPRFVFGPVGGGVGIPWRLVPSLGAKGIIYEVGRSLARISCRHLNPLARAAYGRADLILVQNRETRAWLPVSCQSRVRIFPNIAVEEMPEAGVLPRAGFRPPAALYAGRLLPLKGVAYAIEAVAALPEWRLIVYGSGPDAARLHRIATRRGTRNRVDFRGWCPRTEILRAMKEEADVFLFPSLHDEAGFAVIDALACGLPVVCVDRGGPPVLAGESALPVPATGLWPRAFAMKVADALRLARTGKSVAGSRCRANEFLLEARAEQLRVLLEDVPTLRPATRTAA